MSMRPTAMLVAAGLAVGAVARPLAAQEPDTVYPTISIAGSTAGIAEIVRPGPQGLITYRYRIDNPISSDAGIQALLVDISAPRNVPPRVFWANGWFIADATRGPAAEASHVPVAQEIQDGWMGFIETFGYIEWTSQGEGLEALHSIVPGASRDDFVLHSDHLPGIRAYQLVPDYPHACCPYEAGDPRNEEVSVKEAEDFQVEGWTIGPTVAPESLSLALLEVQLDEVCKRGWISNSNVCQDLDAKLAAAASQLAQGNTAATKQELQGFVAVLEAQHGTGLPVNDNAYWLLKTNALHLNSVNRPGFAGGSNS